MPGFNQTGPIGKGPMTGRGRGRCKAGKSEFNPYVPENVGMGRSMGFGNGFRGGVSDNSGRGFRARRVTLPPADEGNMRVEVDRLRQQTELMQQSLDQIHQRIREMEKSS